MAQIPKEVQEFLVRKNGWVATATPFGTPNTVLQRSIRVVDGKRVVFADLFFRNTGDSPQSSPKVTFAVTDKTTGEGYEIKGTAERKDSGPLFDQVAETLRVAPMLLPPLKYVVDITVESVYDQSMGLQAGIRIA